MNFHYTEEQRQLKNLAQKAATQHIAPIVEKDEEDGHFRAEVIAELGKLGLTGIPASVDYDGAGLGYLEYAIALEEIAYRSSAYAISVAVSGLPQVILSVYGNEAQKKKYIPPLARGEQTCRRPGAARSAHHRAHAAAGDRAA